MLLLIISSCEDAIDFEIPAGKANAIAIQGKLVYNDPTSYVEVLITDLFDFDGTPKRLDIKSVNIENEQGQIIELKSRNFELYTLSIPNSEFNIAINTAFRLNVFLKNDTHIQSNFEHILAISSGTLASEVSDVMIEDDEGEIVNERELKIVSTLSKLNDPDTKIKWDVRRAFRFTNFNSTKLSSDNFFCNTTQLDAAGLCDRLRKDPGSSLALLDCDGGGISNSAECDRGNNPFDPEDDNVDDANIFRSCYISSFVNSNGLNLLDPNDTTAEAFNNDNLTVDLFNTFVDFRFAEGYMVFAIAESLTPTAFEYFRGIKQNSSFAGGMFDPIPGNIKSNLKTIDGENLEVFGFFYSTDQDTQRIYIAPELVGRPDTLCPVIIPFVTTKMSMGNPDGELCVCFDCTEWAGPNDDVTLFRPDFWEE